MKKWRIASLIAMLTLILSGCGKPFLSALDPAGEVAQKQFDLMILSTSIMVLVIIVVVILFVLAILKFRRKKGDESIPKQIEGNHKLEILWTVIPIVLLVILAIPTIYYTFDFANVSAMDKKDSKDGKSSALTVNVRASLYWWEFEYPGEGIMTGQELVVPTDEKVYFNLHASDVKHSFWVPSAGGKMDTNTDNVNKFWLVFDDKKSEDAGRTFYGKCAELCGPSHALMDFKVKALPRDEFDEWVSKMKAATPAEPKDAVAKEGQEIFNKSCIGCHAVDPKDQRPEQARLGPNLANFGDRALVAGILENTKGNVEKWISDPESVKEGNKMTGKYGDLSKDQVNALATYLETLSVK